MCEMSSWETSSSSGRHRASAFSFSTLTFPEEMPIPWVHCSNGLITEERARVCLEHLLSYWEAYPVSASVCLDVPSLRLHHGKSVNTEKTLTALGSSPRRHTRSSARSPGTSLFTLRNSFALIPTIQAPKAPECLHVFCL